MNKILNKEYKIQQRDSKQKTSRSQENEIVEERKNIIEPSESIEHENKCGRRNEGKRGNGSHGNLRSVNRNKKNKTRKNGRKTYHLKGLIKKSNQKRLISRCITPDENRILEIECKSGHLM